MTNNTPIWEQVADALHFIENPAAVAQIADRFDSLYGPVIGTATTEQARKKAIDALSHYLDAGATPRKPWSLSKGDAQRALGALVDLALQ